MLEGEEDVGERDRIIIMKEEHTTSYHTIILGSCEEKYLEEVAYALISWYDL